MPLYTISNVEFYLQSVPMCANKYCDGKLTDYSRLTVNKVDHYDHVFNCHSVTS